MNRKFAKAVVVAAGITSVASAFAQEPTGPLVDWNDVCINYATPNWWSTDFGVQFAGNRLFACTMGASGTVRYDFCPAPSYTVNTRGRLGFSIGPVGSAQTDADDGMALTFGMPNNPASTWGYAMTSRDGTKTLFGSQGWVTTYPGSSDRYFRAITVQDNTQVDLRVDVIGDAARLQWRLQNVGTETAAIGLWFGQYVQMLRGDGNASGIGDLQQTVSIAGLKPLRTERRFIRAQDPSGFPNEVAFAFNRVEAEGLLVSNGPTSATTDAFQNSDATPASEIVIGQAGILLGGRAAGDGTMPDATFAPPGELISDVEFRDDVGYIQKWADQQLAPAATREIVAYYRANGGQSTYSRPYSVVVDTPKVIGLNSADASQYSQDSYLIRVYIDNTRGFATIPGGTEMTLNDVRVSLTLPPGIVMASGNNVRTINRIDPKGIASVDFLVTPDGTTAGELNYQVKIEPTPGDAKTVTGTLLVATQPKLLIRENANLVTTPWTFAPATWETILNPLLPDQDFQAFTWDPQQNGYVIQTGPERGKATWILSDNDLGLFNLGGNPTQPTDTFPSGTNSDVNTPVVQLKSGWNLIGNPFSYPIQLGQLVGVSASNPAQSFTFQELVNQGIISGSLSYWDEQTQSYKFIDRASSRIVPNRGYWMYVSTVQDFTLRFPAVFDLWARSATDDTKWTQSDRQWRAQIVARTSNGIDDQNFVGIARSAAESTRNRVMEPPMAPVKGAVSVSVEETGTGTRLAQSLSDRSGRNEWKMLVETKDAGPVTVTWPNLSSVPKNVRFRIIDVATGASRDMRKNSGYTFEAAGASTREFKIQSEPGTVSRAVIGNVVVSGATRGPGSSVTLNYTLSQDANTSVRVLAGGGKEIYSMTRGRADRAGQNSVTWNLRDSANRAVAPGTYKVEIVAESDSGDRVRRIVPVIVTR